ncbi:MAG: Zn-ribbon domain-containing OB-fold protein [Actinomycetota bacterium]
MSDTAVSRPKPAQSADTSFFWDGAKRGELLIQRCASCGTLRHPPGPGCASCGSVDWDTVRSSGRGTVHSFAVHHYPPIPGFEYPLAIGLVDLEEGTRLISNIVGIDPDSIEIGMAVEVAFESFGDDLALPQFRPA